ncbi:unnamed protein product [Rhizoctonia solani]|uniref:Protein CPL1-like domain-containing protein n=1 Tax=Rhizoctonia solani TaxID=456999 RepID=A0A8H2WKB7_9AGAM|nr:unnamed protein product [Rhizoctonia solani]
MLRITAVALASLAFTSFAPIWVTGKTTGSGGDQVLPVNPPPSGSIPGPSLWRRACQPGQYSIYGSCQSCGRGYYCSGNGESTACPAGTYNDPPETTSQRSSECKTIQCGYKPSGANADGTAATSQTACGVGYYSKAGSTNCTICPAGMYCNAQTTCNPKPCDPGTYADTAGSGQRCKDCPAGTFNNSYGNISCCNCCAGWFSQGSNTHTNCERCPNIGEVQSIGVTGPVGSDSRNKCTIYTGLAGQQRPAQTCSQPQTQTPGTCPATSGNTPSSAMTRSTMTTCPYGTTLCEVKSGRGGFECVDTLNSLETCGGCDNDCSSLGGTNEVQCLKGQCVIKSCAPGHELAVRRDGISRGGLEVGIHCVAKKRNYIRHATML